MTLPRPTHSPGPAPRIAVVGSYGTGLTMRLHRVPAAGETVSGGQFSQGPGGKGSNQAIGAARLGASVGLLTAVGDDSYAASARALWAEEGVDASGVVTVDAPTMVGFIMVDTSAENHIALAPGALDRLTPQHVDGFAAVIAAADMMMVCNEIPTATVVAALRTAKHHGVRTLYNPAPARDLPEEARRYIDYLTPNFGEARMLAGADSAAGPGEILDRLRQRFTATVVLTAGSDGAYVDDGRSRVHIPAVTPPRLVDTTGAGDAFNAALAVSLCRGESPAAAAETAVRAGAFAVTRAEVIPGLPRPDDLAGFLEPGT